MKFYRLSGATFYDCINTIYHFIKPFLDNKMSIFEEYGAFKQLPYLPYVLWFGRRSFFYKDNGKAHCPSVGMGCMLICH